MTRKKGSKDNSKRTRMTVGERTRNIFDAAMDEAVENGLLNFSISKVSERCYASRSLITLYFNDVDSLRSRVVAHAVAAEQHKINNRTDLHNGHLKVIREALVMTIPEACTASKELKKAAADTLT